MSDMTHTPNSPLDGAVYDGFARICEVGPLGMITLRARHDMAALPAALQAAVGLAMPEPRRMVMQGGKGVGWMSPDEWLLILPYAEVATALAAIETALKDQHFLAVDVSDARAVFRILGPQAAQVLMKLCPVDLANLAPGELRRTRAAQVAAAFWREGDGFTLVAFRSVADYVMQLLRHSAQPGSEIG